MSSAGDNPIVKVMTITHADFARSLALFDPAARLDEAGVVVAQSDGVRAQIAFEPLPSQTLGGLLSLPRARVTITFDAATSSPARRAFLHRFDIAFQRGGG